jgi:hypothetical protein
MTILALAQHERLFVSWKEAKGNEARGNEARGKRQEARGNEARERNLMTND